MRTLDALVADVPAFAGMKPAQLELVAGCGANKVFAAGELLMREGDPADTFYVIRHGIVAIEAFAPGRGPITIETIHEGDLLGWSWLVPPHRTVFDARALDTTRTTAFDGACLRGKCDADPALGYALLQRFAPVIVERLQAARIRLLDVYGPVTTSA